MNLKIKTILENLSRILLFASRLDWDRGGAGGESEGTTPKDATPAANKNLSTWWSTAATLASHSSSFHVRPPRTATGHFLRVSISQGARAHITAEAKRDGTSLSAVVRRLLAKELLRCHEAHFYPSPRPHVKPFVTITAVVERSVYAEIERRARAAHRKPGIYAGQMCAAALARRRSGAKEEEGRAEA